MKDIDFAVGEYNVKGKVFFPNALLPKNPAILFIPGWRSIQDRNFVLAEKLNVRGYICMTFDFRGHGVSDGNFEKFSIKDFLDDVIAAYDILAKQPGVDVENITVAGVSFGGYLGAILSSKKKVKNLILRVPACYRDEDFEKLMYIARATDEHKEWMTKVHDFKESRATRATHDFLGRILVIESEKDEVVPQTVIQSYLDSVDNKNNLTHIIMRGAPHSLSKDAPRQIEFENIMLGWLK